MIFSFISFLGLIIFYFSVVICNKEFESPDSIFHFILGMIGVIFGGFVVMIGTYYAYEQGAIDYKKGEVCVTVDSTSHKYIQYDVHHK